MIIDVTCSTCSRLPTAMHPTLVAVGYCINTPKSMEHGAPHPFPTANKAQQTYRWQKNCQATEESPSRPTSSHTGGCSLGNCPFCSNQNVRVRQARMCTVPASRPAPGSACCWLDHLRLVSAIIITASSSITRCACACPASSSSSSSRLCWCVCLLSSSRRVCCCC